METRAAIGQYNPGSGELTLWCSSQNPHIHRMVLSEILDISEAKLRVIAPDMGGGFGGKIGVYPDEALSDMLHVTCVVRSNGSKREVNILPLLIWSR